MKLKKAKRFKTIYVLLNKIILSRGFKMDVTDADFQEKVLEQSRKVPVLADFWASWCMPCQIFKPVLEKMEKSYGGKFVLAKINVDNAPKTAMAYGVRGIPSVKLFMNGEMVDEFTGALPEEKLKEWLDNHF